MSNSEWTIKEWVSGTAYTIGSNVSLNNITYRLCNPQLSVTQLPSDNNSGWISYWNSTTKYSPDIIVFHENYFYTWWSIEISPPNILPDTRTNNWQQWVGLVNWSSTGIYSSNQIILSYGILFMYVGSTQSVAGVLPSSSNLAEWRSIWSNSMNYSYGDCVISPNGVFIYNDCTNQSTPGQEPADGVGGWNYYNSNMLICNNNILVLFNYL